MPDMFSTGFHISFFDIKKAKRNFSNTRKYVVGYARLSVDEDGENYVSIEHQKSILEEIYLQQYMDDTSEYIFIADDDVSGYKFERQGLYQIAALIEAGRCNIILAKDLSRIGRHSALTQLFIEQCERVGVRISAMNDYDSNKESDELILGIRAWSNERVVKDASAKAIKIVRHRQKNGTWFCAAPFGYTVVNYQKGKVEIDEEAAEIVRRIFDMYLGGKGLTAIARILTKERVPTPSMIFRERSLAMGDDCRRPVTSDWQPAIISTILSNEFYLGTLITGRYRRDGINGKDIRMKKDSWNRFENHHPPIIDEDVFRAVQEIKASHQKYNYRPKDGREHLFHGLVYCGDCGAVEYAYATKKLATQYICSAYFKYGRDRCSRHRVKESLLTRIAIDFLKIARESCREAIDSLDEELFPKRTVKNDEDTLAKLQRNLDSIHSQLQVIEEQRIKQIIAHPEREESLNQIYDNMADSALKSRDELLERIEHIKEYMRSATNAAQKAKKTIDIIDSVIESGELTRNAAVAIFDRITVYEDGNIDIKLKPYLKALDPQNYPVVDKAVKRPDEHYVITSGQHLEGEFSSINDSWDGDPSHTSFIHTITLILDVSQLAQRISLHKD